MNPHGFLRVVQRVLSKMGNSSLISMMKEVYKEPIYIFLLFIFHSHYTVQIVITYRGINCLLR